MVVARFEVYLVRLDPTEGHEIQKMRLVRRLGKISDKAAGEALAVLGEMFAQ